MRVIRTRTHHVTKCPHDVKEMNSTNHVRVSKHVNKRQQKRATLIPRSRPRSYWTTTMLLHSSSPFSHCSTPSRSSYHSARSHQPLTSSPLASPTYSSPTHEAQQRRRAQYKPMTPMSCRSPVASASAKLLFRTGQQTPEEPQKAFLRERFQARCREHAQKQRERAVNSRRSSDRFSDVFMDCDDDEESDDVVMQDEVRLRP